MASPVTSLAALARQAPVATLAAIARPAARQCGESVSGNPPKEITGPARTGTRPRGVTAASAAVGGDVASDAAPVTPAVVSLSHCERCPRGMAPCAPFPCARTITPTALRQLMARLAGHPTDARHGAHQR